jgi:selenocysteine-specific elongation factor
MLAGASGLDLAMLVVAADDSVMPQTREHLEILQLLGLSNGLVALTKCDLVDPSWIGLVEEEVRDLVRGTFLEHAPIIRTSAVTGVGVSELRGALRELCERIAPKEDKGLFRMAIDRSFTVTGHGTVVTGTVNSGTVSVGDELEWLPSGKSVRVRGLHRHDQSVEQIGRGSRAAINLVGVHHDEICRGNELAAPGYLTATRIVSLEVVSSPYATRSLRHRGRYRVHLGTAEVTGTLALMDGNALETGAIQLGQLFLAEPVVAVYGQPIVLRQESPPATLGGGRVLQPTGSRIRRRERTEIQRLERLRSTNPQDRLIAALGFVGIQPCSERRLCALTGISPELLDGAMSHLIEEGALLEVPINPRRSMRILTDVVATLEDRVIRALDRLHESRPRLSAIPRASLSAELPDLASNSLIPGIIERLRSQERVTVDARAVALSGYVPRLSQAELRLKTDLMQSIRNGGMSPPETAELAAKAGARSLAVPELIALLCDEQKVTEISADLHIDFDAEAELRHKVTDYLTEKTTMTMAELRDLLGTTRKYAVPIGEYLDRIGLTTREGDIRRLNHPEPRTRS